MEQPTFAREAIFVSDILHDTSDGPIVVLEITKTRIMARLLGKDQRRVTYNFDGIQARRSERTLFWHKPMLVEPMKSSAEWEVQRKFLTEINSLFARYIRSGQVIPLQEIEDPVGDTEE